MSIKTSNILAIPILTIAMLQFIGGWLNITAIKGLGASLAMAPYTKVFSDVKGLETFASSFSILTKDGTSYNSLAITPEVYNKLGGSYNRRNVYGAAISYGPKLPETLRRQVFHYALKEPGILVRELELPKAEAYIIEVKTNTKNRNDIWYLACTEEEEKEFIKLKDL
jgi:hypothetical protein